MATMLSTSGTARGKTQGSCLKMVNVSNTYKSQNFTFHEHVMMPHLLHSNKKIIVKRITSRTCWCDSLLLSRNCCCRFKSYTQNYVFAIGYSSLDTPAIVCDSSKHERVSKIEAENIYEPDSSSVINIKRIVMLRASSQSPCKSRPNLKTLFNLLVRKVRHTSNPFAAGRERQDLARSASILSKTGDPIPLGTFRTTSSITPPTLSPDRL